MLQWLLAFVHDFLKSYVFLIPLAVLVLSDITKVLVDCARRRESLLSGHWLGNLFRPGGIPSTHSAFVTSLLIVVAYREGFSSTLFAVTFVFACVVWYDAFGVRQAVGQQAEILNRLQRWKHFSERLGHSFVEVLAGIAFGAIVTAVGIWLA